MAADFDNPPGAKMPQVFSLGIVGGRSEFSVLNENASTTAFAGLNFGLESSLRIITLGTTGVHLFGRYLIHQQKNKFDSDESVENKQIVFGFKLFLVPDFYLGLGMANNSFNFKTKSTDITVPSSGPAIGLGYEFYSAKDFNLGLNAWYSNSALKNQGSLTTNSFAEGGAFFLSFLWSPAVNVFGTGRVWPGP